MNLGIEYQLPVVLAAGSGWVPLVITIDVIIGLVIAWKLSDSERYGESAISLGTVAIVGLMLLESLVPGVLVDLGAGSRFLLGLAIVIAAATTWLTRTERVGDAATAIAMLVYVGIAVVVFAFWRDGFFSISTGWRIMLAIVATFAVPLSFGNLVARGLKVPDLGGRMGVVLLAITMALWPFIYQVLHGDVEQSEWRASVKIWTEREENDQVKANKKFAESLNNARKQHRNLPLRIDFREDKPSPADVKSVP